MCGKLADEPGNDTLWHALLIFEGYKFHTAKELPFTHTIKGGELFVSRKEKSITRYLRWRLPIERQQNWAQQPEI